MNVLVVSTLTLLICALSSSCNLGCAKNVEKRCTCVIWGHNLRLAANNLAKDIFTFQFVGYESTA